MLQVLGKIFGSGNVVSEGLKLIDNMHTSDTELIEANSDAATKLIDAKSKARSALLTAYAPFKVAQRLLAIIFSITFILSFMLVLGLTLKGGGGIEDVRMVLSEFYIGPIMLTIIVFYFGGGTIDSLKAKANK